MDDQATSTYLQDHLTGARTVIEMVQRRLDRGDGPADLTQFLAELEEERGIIEALAASSGSVGKVKQAAGWVAERAAVLKLAVDGSVEDGLRDLLELETFKTGVEGKQCLFRTLDALDDWDALTGVDVPELLAQAERQADMLESHRLRVALQTLRT